MIRIVLGGVLVVVGSVWVAQALNAAFAPVSFMTGDGMWGWVGAVAALGGFFLIWWGVRSRHEG